MEQINADLLVIGGGLGGVAAALSALEMDRTVVLAEESDWIGGQLTAQGVPPDESPWVDGAGASSGFGGTRSYRRLREGIRDYYRRYYPLSEAAARNASLNPGAGNVSPLCHEPRVALAVLEGMIAPYLASRRLDLRLGYRAVAAETDGDRVRSVRLEGSGGAVLEVVARYVLDATDLGELLPLANAEHVYGAESARSTGELHALSGDSEPLNQQSFTWCYVVDHLAGEDHTIERPSSYDFWRTYRPDFWPDRLLSWVTPDPETLEAINRPIFTGPADDERGADLWHYRRILYRRYHRGGSFPSDLVVVNWPQIDYWLGPLVGVSDEERDRHLQGARDLSLSMLYWMQTEAPRRDGGAGYPGLRLRGDALGTDSLAKSPYIREGRRIQARFTVLEQHVGVEAREGVRGAERFSDSVGIGSYRIDLHPSSNGRNYIDISTWPFQIPLGALVPVRLRNLLPAGKCLGVTHVTNGCFRLHPVEWNIGESAGALAAYCLDRRTEPSAVLESEALRVDFQSLLAQKGIELEWPEDLRLTPRYKEDPLGV